MSVGRFSCLVAATLSLAAVCFASVGCRHRIRSFVISAGMEPGWVAVVLSDPACSEPDGSTLEARIKVPSTGYVCTSLRVPRGPVVDHYYREMQDGSLQELELDKDIRVPAITEIKGGSCQVVAKTFWYGPREKMQGDPSVVIRKNRSECQ